MALAWTRVGREKPISARDRRMRASRRCENEENVVFFSTK